MPNFAWTTGKALPAAVNGQTFERYNFAQKVAHTSIFAGVTGLTFRGCNLTNCDVPAGSVVVDCNVGQMEYCANANPALVERGLLAAEAENCTHVTGTDVIQVTGVTVETVYHYSDKVVV